MLAALADDNPATALLLASEQQAAGVELDALRPQPQPGCRRLKNTDGQPAAENRRRYRFFHHQLAGAIRQTARTALAAEHERAPDMPRRRARPPAPPDAADAVPPRLRRPAQRTAENRPHRPDQRLAAPARASRANSRQRPRSVGQILKPLLNAEPYNPPRVRDIARASGIGEDTVRALFKRVARIGEAYPVAHDHYFTASTVADLAQRVAALNARNGAPAPPRCATKSAAGARSPSTFSNSSTASATLGAFGKRTPCAARPSNLVNEQRKRSFPGGATGLQNR
jgi:selenocysteine-specific elongation factor